jgi:hypothetical protein
MERRVILPLTAAALLALAAPEASGLTFLQLMTGDEAVPGDARSAAMGRTLGAAPRAGFTAAGNPALLARVRAAELSIGGGGTKLKETRSIPAYDSFDGFLVESVYVLNDMSSSELALGGAASPAEGGLGSRFGLGIHNGTIWDLRYDYTEEVRDPSAFVQPRDALLAINDIQSDGAIRAWDFGLGFSALDQLDVGLAFQLATGDQTLLARTWFVPADSTVQGQADLGSLSGNRWTAGLAWHPHHSFSASGFWRSELALTGTYTLAGDPDYLEWLAELGVPSGTGPARVEYPQEIGAGITWRPRAKTRTTIQADLNWREWSRYRNTLWETPDLKDAWDARVGVEHVFYNGLPVRFGFLYGVAPQDEDITRTAFTFGLGFGRGPAKFDLGFELASRDYRYRDVFDDGDLGGSSRGDGPTDLVKETTTGVFLSLSWATDSIGG